MRLILASSSPRRLDLLASIGVVPDSVVSTDIDEAPLKAEQPRQYVLRLAAEKARVVERSDDQVVLAGDTVVALGRRILDKAHDAPDVTRFLGLLSGRRHSVLSAIAVIDGEGRLRTRISASTVRFRRLAADEIADYAASGEGVGKAGGYAIQGRAAGLIAWIEGSHSAIVGLPLFETRTLLRSAGLACG